jgi:hypothetical protein
VTAHLGQGHLVMVAAVATEEPQIAPKAAQVSTAAIASPPLKRAIAAAATSNSALLMPPWVAKLPIRMNSGITLRS